MYIVNTCTVTHVADRKARHSLRSAKRRNPRATIVVTGCYPQRSPDDLRQLKEVDIVTGNVDKASLVRLVTEWRGEAPVPCAVGAEAEILTPRIARTRAMVKIQEGCDQVCAYCIVPKVRGRERSIPSEEIIGEIQRHVGQGYREVVLTGTQLGSYGFDLPNMTLTRLLARILSETDVTRLRISSLQPQDIGPEMLDLWSDGRLCPHFHLPLQSGSDTVLRCMRRRYSASLYAEVVELIRHSVPEVSITADVIVGFPGESKKEFEETYALCDRIGFASMHVFPYSVRPGTSAAHFDSQVSSTDKSRRMRALLDLAESQAIEFRRGFQGRVRPVLWEEVRDANSVTSVWSGLTDNYIRVVARNSSDLTNQVTLARLGEQVSGSVLAEILQS